MSGASCFARFGKESRAEASEPSGRAGGPKKIEFMSRIGKMPVAVPPKVKVEITGQHVSVEGPKGKLGLDLPARTGAKLEGANVVVSRSGEDAEAKSLHGLSRALINNMIKGVSEGFVKKLEIQGVGFKAAVQGDKVNLSLGYSHPVNYLIPGQIKVTVEENTKLTIEGPDKQVVGQVAAEIRSYYPPEPYKGKGVRYVGEKVVRKEGKTVQ
jgi:large subunit ribosomal protein L6